jgi:hypothetical protein
VKNHCSGEIQADVAVARLFGPPASPSSNIQPESLTSSGGSEKLPTALIRL